VEFIGAWKAECPQGHMRIFTPEKCQRENGSRRGAAIPAETIPKMRNPAQNA
jgi:hypothetical protein